MPMKKYYLGADVSKGYCDFILLDRDHNIVEQIFQLDDTADGTTLSVAYDDVSELVFE